MATGIDMDERAVAHGYGPSSLRLGACGHRYTLADDETVAAINSSNALGGRRRHRSRYWVAVKDLAGLIVSTGDAAICRLRTAREAVALLGGIAATVGLASLPFCYQH